MTTMAETFSPFGELETNLQDASSIPAATSQQPLRAPLASPFGALPDHELGVSEVQEWEDATRELLTELEDEDFTDSLEALVDEAAARHTIDLTSWSTAPAP